METRLFKLPPISLIIILVLLMKITQNFATPFNFPQTLINVASGFVFLSAFLFIGLGIAKQRKHKNWTNLLLQFNSPILITGGVYSVTRNPIYLGLILLVGAFGLYWQNSLFILFVLLAFYLMQRFYISIEEKWLLNIYSDDYVDYCKRVSRWL